MAQNAGGSNLPRTPDGHPDFQGVWTSRFLTPLERRDGVRALVVTDEEAKALAAEAYARRHGDEFGPDDPDVKAANIQNFARVNGEWRTSLVTAPSDGKVPYIPEVRQQNEAARKVMLSGAADGPEARPQFERCLAGTGRAPFDIVPAHNMRQIVQTPGHLMLYTEEGGDVRIIEIGGVHRPPALDSFIGDSTAHWEGDVLVVETLNQRIRPGISPGSRVLERLMLLSADELLYRYTIEDPTIYAQPWSAEFSLNRSNERIFEYACQMANYTLGNILHVARMAEERRAIAADKEKGKPKPKKQVKR